MDSIFVFITIIIAIILLVLIVNRNTNNTSNTSNTNNSNNKNKYENFNKNNNDIVEDYDEKQIKENSYSLVGNEDDYKNVIDGYENELIFDNNLKSGDYVNQFKEIDLTKFPKTNNQIGFNPQPRESLESKLPFADINVNCL